MKKIMRKSVCLIIVTALILLTFNLSVSSQTSKEKIALKEPILTNVERVEIDTNEQQEISLGKYTKDVSTISNANAEAMLRKFDVPFEDIKTAEVIYDNSLDRTVNRIKSDKAQIDFDERGNIVGLINYEDFSTVDKDRRDYATNQNKSVPDPVVKYKTEAELGEFLKYIVQCNNLETYKLVRCEFDGYDTWMLKWNNVLENGIINLYDSFSVHFDATDGSIRFASRSKNEPNTIVPIITSQQALQFAEPVVSLFPQNSKTSTELEVFRPNFYWESDTFYESANFVRLAWKVSINGGNAVVYIDAETGENLGGGQTKSAARAVGPVPSFVNNSESVELAAEGLAKLGYEQPNAPVTYYIGQSDINWIMNSAPYYALYLSCHGDRDTTLLCDSEVIENSNWVFRATSLNSNSLWYFVFLDACYSGKKDTWYKAFGCNKSAGTGFLGWKIEMNVYDAYVFCDKFWDLVGTMALNDAAELAQERAEDIVGSGRCPIAFHGDRNYYGWDWN